MVLLFCGPMSGLGYKISGDKKRTRVYEQFVKKVCLNWDQVSRLCLGAIEFEKHIGQLVCPAGCGEP
jgi:hypothetical protein